MAFRFPSGIAAKSGLECVTLIDDCYAATLQFRDQPRVEGAPFIHHLGPKHHFDRILIVSGDREADQPRGDVPDSHEHERVDVPQAILGELVLETRHEHVGYGVGEHTSLRAH